MKHEKKYLWAILSLATVLRLWSIRTAWFGFDEKFTMGMARALPSGFWHIVLTREANMVAYYVLVRAWLKLYGLFSPGFGITWVRLLSVVFSVATIPLVWAIGRRLYNARVGLTAAGLLAINAFHIKHAYNARCYALFAFVVTLAIFLLVRNFGLPSTERSWGGYCVLWILAAYIHVFAFFFMAAHLLAFAILRAYPKLWQLAAVAVSVAPMLVWAASHRGLPLTWVDPLSGRSAARVFDALIGNDGAMLLIIVVAALTTLVHAADKVDSAILTWAILPFSMVVVASLFQPCLVARYLLPCAPAIAIATGASLHKVRPLVGLVLGLLILFGMLMGTQDIGA